MNKKINKIQPQKVQKIVCPKCGELMMKLYPWSSVGILPNAKFNPCGKCTNRLSTLKV